MRTPFIFTVVLLILIAAAASHSESARPAAGGSVPEHELVDKLGPKKGKGAKKSKRGNKAERKRQGAVAKKRRDARPNIVVVMVDDQAHNSFSRRIQPKTFRQILGDDGTRFRRAIAVPPLCCPSRAGFLTGQYPHNHSVLSNNYNLLRQKRNVLPTWLRRSGYYTGFVGKFLNKYDRTQGLRPAPGWSYWWASDGRPVYYNAPHSDQGRRERAKGYLTNATTKRGIDFLRRAPRNRPYFMWLSYYAPHVSRDLRRSFCARSAPQVPWRDWKRFRNAPLPTPQSFNEINVADKAAEVREFGRIDDFERRRIERRLRCTMAAMQAVDRGVAKVARQIKRRGDWENTVIVYLSDNGFFFGEHRIPSGKSRPYREAVEVPFLMRVPKRVLGRRAPRSSEALVANIDLAPTFLRLARAKPCLGGSCRTLDGRSLLPLLRGQKDFAGRTMLLELGGGECRRYEGVWTAQANYTEWFEQNAWGECRVADREYYDRSADPHQLDNHLALSASARGSAGVPGSKQLQRRLRQMRGCTGISGRDRTKRPCE